MGHPLKCHRDPPYHIFESDASSGLPWVNILFLAEAQGVYYCSGHPIINDGKVRYFFEILSIEGWWATFMSLNPEDCATKTAPKIMQL